MSSVPRQIAALAAQKGARAYYVGGCVRDRLLGRGSSDVDIEVHGMAADALFDMLRQVGEPLSYGESFGIYSLKGTGIDIALPRTEKATGRGHRDFEVSVDPYIGLKAAARRRDFTVNAMMEDILTGQIIDPFGGQKDLQNGILRHVDEQTFPEDPLRVLRGAQFASRFGFTTDPKTMELYRHISLKDLSRERVEEELKKALLKGSRPSVFFEVLRDCGQLEYWFSPLHLLPQLQQDPVYHPEGDVWIHTMQVLDRGAAFRGQVSDPYAFLLLCLTHDLGKLTTTAVGKDGRIHAYGHEAEGLSLIEEFLRRFTADKAVIDYVLNMVPLHMKPNLAAWNRSALRTTNRLFDEAAAPKDLIYFAMADKPVMSFDTPFEGDSAFLFQRYEDYLQVMERPYVAGRDLIEAGLSPGPEFKAYLEYAHKLRLAGIDKESALKQTLAMAGIKTKKEKKKHGRSADRKQ